MYWAGSSRRFATEGFATQHQPIRDVHFQARADVRTAPPLHLVDGSRTRGFEVDCSALAAIGTGRVQRRQYGNTADGGQLTMAASGNSTAASCIIELTLSTPSHRWRASGEAER